MDKREPEQKRQPSAEAPPPPRAPGRGWLGKLALLGLTIVLLSFAFAPFGQFYLALIGLVPWLLVVRETRSQRAAFLWSWLGGTAFFTANMWWLVFVTGPGMVALMMFLGLYWGVAAMVIRGAGLLRNRNDFRQAPALMPGLSKEYFSSWMFPSISIVLIPAIWVTLEWIRGCFPFNGLPWLFLGHAQTPILPMCQIADVVGVYGISFWVMMINVLVALVIIDHSRIRQFISPILVLLIVTVASFAYGLFRMNERATTPGPKVLVIQPNYPQSNSGEKGASSDEIVRFQVSTTEEAIRQAGPVDLVVWSETMMPELNQEYRAAATGFSVERSDGTKIPDYGQYLDDIHKKLESLCREHHAALLTGGIYCNFPKPKVMDRRNSAFFFSRDGVEDTAHRYDKIHLVPWGEYIPFKGTIPWLYDAFARLSPYGDDSYTLTAGGEDALTVFPLTDGVLTYRFVTPICFEDIDAALVSQMFRPERKPTSKRADFIVNITNDGWFRANEMPQHFQAAVFRSIENRVPTARSVNTGISGFIDSAGRVDPSKLVPTKQTGWSAATLMLDQRITFYTRFGDVFAILCFATTLAVTIWAIAAHWRRRKGE